jgi:D-glycero-D-manno-heptose 1,7-bisphosphate phosphatase
MSALLEMPLDAGFWLDSVRGREDIEIEVPLAAGFLSRQREGLRPGLVLDRDGVIVEEVNYLSRSEDVRLLPGVPELLEWAKLAGVPVGVATNQAGIARGLFGWPQYRSVNAAIRADLVQFGCGIDQMIACGFHPHYTVGYGEDHAYWRKPGPGMLHILADRLRLDLGRSWLIGDNVSDILAARASGMAGAMHLNTGHGKHFRSEALQCANGGFAVIPGDDCRDALKALRGILVP